MAGDRRRRIGALGESLAAEHLAAGGYRMLARNYRTRYGELDIVAAERGCIVFCEVKSRVGTGASGPVGPLDSIGPDKRRRLRRMATQWLFDRREGDGAAAGEDELRFDAIGVTLAPDGSLVSLEHVRDAF